RELTKLHEEVLRGRVSVVLARLGDVDPKGEIAVVLEGRREEDEIELPRLVEEARGLVEGGMRKREAAATIARRHHASANVIYDALVRPSPV
ncbi:MAG: 16S rRNA (cytidine(1402)-2'-O)-methyltransferase, partial [Actinomycetota bacterium]